MHFRRKLFETLPFVRSPFQVEGRRNDSRTKSRKECASCTPGTARNVLCELSSCSYDLLVISQWFFFLKTNQHHPPTTNQTNKPYSAHTKEKTEGAAPPHATQQRYQRACPFSHICGWELHPLGVSREPSWRDAYC